MALGSSLGPNNILALGGRHGHPGENGSGDYVAMALFQFYFYLQMLFLHNKYNGMFIQILLQQDVLHGPKAPLLSYYAPFVKPLIILTRVPLLLLPVLILLLSS